MNIPSIATFSNDHVDLVIGADGSIVSLRERDTGRDWQNAKFRVPMFGAIRSGVPIAPTRIEYREDRFLLAFDQIGFSCSVSCRATETHFRLKVETISTGRHPEVLTFFGASLKPSDGMHGRQSRPGVALSRAAA
jgi:hypothetical protein